MYVHFFPPLLSFPRSRADIFECFSLMRQPFYLSLSSRRLEVIGSRKELGARGRHPLPSRVSLTRPVLSCAQLLPSACYAGYYYLKVMLHETIRNDNFYRNNALQCCNDSKQRRNNVVMLCCAQNRRYESFRVTSS